LIAPPIAQTLFFFFLFGPIFSKLPYHSSIAYWPRECAGIVPPPPFPVFSFPEVSFQDFCWSFLPLTPPFNWVNTFFIKEVFFFSLPCSFSCSPSTPSVSDQFPLFSLIRFFSFFFPWFFFFRCPFFPVPLGSPRYPSFFLDRAPRNFFSPIFGIDSDGPPLVPFFFGTFFFFLLTKNSLVFLFVFKFSLHVTNYP